MASPLQDQRFFGDPRAALARLAKANGDDLAGLSRFVGRNPAYIQQYLKRGSPRALPEDVRRTLARYFGVDETVLGGAGAAAPPRFHTVPRLAIGASAGPGSTAGEERTVGGIAFDPAWLKREALDRARLSIVRVEGDSMVPTLADGDEIMVDTGDGAARLRDGIYVLRDDDAVLVKRLARGPGRGSVDVVSDNPVYPRRAALRIADLAIVGRVVWIGRRLT